MDYVLSFADKTIFTPHVYPDTWAEDDILRQFISLYVIVCVGGALIYLVPATLNYFIVFDHKLLKHPKMLPNQVNGWCEDDPLFSSSSVFLLF